MVVPVGITCRVIGSRRFAKSQNIERSRSQNGRKQGSVTPSVKPLPYLLCQMNLLLHGLEAPKVA